MTTEKKNNIILSAFGATLLLGWVLIWFVSPQFEYLVNKLDRPVISLWVLLTVIGLVFVVFIYWMTRQQSFRSLTQNQWIIIIGFGLLMRFVTFLSTPILENDFERYFLDGNLILNGMNPYEVYPKDIQEAAKDPEAFKDGKFAPLLTKEGMRSISHVNHPNIRTVYPPVAQVIFAGSQLIKPWNLMAWKVVLLFMELLLILVLVKILIFLKMPLLQICIFWWNPIVIKEFYNSAHMDLIIILPLAASLLLYLKQRVKWSGALLGVAVGAKLWPIILAPLFLKGIEKGKWPKYLIAFTISAGIALAPLLFITLDSDSGFIRFGKYWAMNDAIFGFLNNTFQSIFALSYDQGFQSARLVSALFILGALGYFWKSPFMSREKNIESLTKFACIFFLLLPTQFPWYFTWILLFLTIYPHKTFLLYSSLLFTYYLRFHFMYRGDADIFDNKIVFIEHGIIYVLLLSELWQNTRQKSERVVTHEATQ